jgi:hypothetical protein
MQVTDDRATYAILAAARPLTSAAATLSPRWCINTTLRAAAVLCPRTWWSACTRVGLQTTSACRWANRIDCDCVRGYCCASFGPANGSVGSIWHRGCLCR